MTTMTQAEAARLLGIKPPSVTYHLSVGHLTLEGGRVTLASVKLLQKRRTAMEKARTIR